MIQFLGIDIINVFEIEQVVGKRVYLCTKSKIRFRNAKEEMVAGIKG